MFKDDEEWVRSQIQKLPPNLMKKARDGYAASYKEAFMELKETGEIKRIQHARTTANTRLRNYVDRVLKANGSR